MAARATSAIGRRVEGTRLAIAVVAGAAAVRLLVAAVVPLVPDEAYYWEWSRHLAAGYFDHPPAIAWLIRAGTAVAGDTPFGVRVVPVLVGCAGSLAAVLLACRLGGGRAAVRAAVLIAVLPLAGVGLVLATPDVPLLASAGIALWAIDHAIAAPPTDAAGRSAGPARPSAGLAWWVVAGLATGAGLLSKYTIVLLPAGIALACVVSPRLRGQLRAPSPYVACAIALLLFAPVVAWNAAHGWASFAFQLRHGLGAPAGSALARELALIGGQLGLATPVLFPLMVAEIVVALRRPVEPRRFALAVTAGLVWLFFVLSALRRPVEPNWPALAVLPALVVLAAAAPAPMRDRWTAAGAVLGALIVAAVYAHAVHPWLPLMPRRDPVAQAYGWSDLAAVVERGRRTADPPAAHDWIAADRYQDASELAFHLPGHPDVFSLGLASRRSEFDLWPGLGSVARRGDALTLVLDETPGRPPPVAALAPHFATVVRGDLVELRWGAHRVVARRRVWHFLDLITPLDLSRPAPFGSARP